jgi:hypothetical protein
MVCLQHGFVALSLRVRWACDGSLVPQSSAVEKSQSAGRFGAKYAEDDVGSVLGRLQPCATCLRLKGIGGSSRRACPASAAVSLVFPHRVRPPVCTMQTHCPGIVSGFLGEIFPLPRSQSLSLHVQGVRWPSATPSDPVAWPWGSSALSSARPPTPPPPPTRPPSTSPHAAAAASIMTPRSCSLAGDAARVDGS